MTSMLRRLAVLVVALVLLFKVLPYVITELPWWFLPLVLLGLAARWIWVRLVAIADAIVPGGASGGES